MRYARHGFLLSTEGATEPRLPAQGLARTPRSYPQPWKQLAGLVIWCLNKN